MGRARRQRKPCSSAFLFAPLEFTTDAWQPAAARPKIFQVKRLLGQKRQKNIHRAELEEKHGYDTKDAMHVIRLYGEARERMPKGRITLPRPNRDELLAIRMGKDTLAECKKSAVRGSQKR